MLTTHDVAREGATNHGMMIEVVAVVRGHFPGKGAISVEIKPGCSIRRGDTLLGRVQGGDGQPVARTICANSIQLNRNAIEVGEAG